MQSLEPKLLTVIREGYTTALFGRDLVAGVTVGIVALPLAIAFAVASGVAPAQGLYTAIIAGFLISVLSGSRVQIGGPTGAFIVLVYEIVHRFGYDGLVVATVLAGGLLIAMGIARLGSIIQFIPYPVTVGFTAGIAVVIASSQLRDGLGLEMSEVPAKFIPKWSAYFNAIGSLNPWAAAITVATVVILLAFARFVPRVPGSIVAVLTLTIAVSVFNIPVETIGSRFGDVPNTLPTLRLPHIDWSTLPDLVSPALSIALLAAIESLLSAVVADGMTGRRHRPNAELLAQGVANLVTPFFGGIPATGAIARTATNIKAGGQTPVAGIIHAITLLLILLVAGRWAALIPMSVLAGILLVVAYNMSELHFFCRIVRDTTKSDAMVVLSTFTLTVLIDLTIALQVGVVMAAFLFMRRMAEVSNVTALDLVNGEDSEISAAELKKLKAIPSSVEVFEINGPFFFGAANKFASAITHIENKPSVLVLRLHNVPTIDATGLRVLVSLQDQSEKRHGPSLILEGVQPQPRHLLTRSKFLARVGDENVVSNLDAALNRARELLAIEHRDADKA